MGLLQTAIGEGGAVVANGIAGGGKLAVVVIGAAAQDLAGASVVAEIFEGKTIEVVEAAADRQVLAPPVGIALEGDAAPGVDLAHLVGAAASGAS